MTPNFESNKTSLWGSCHITDLFFHSEFAQTIGTEASNRWFLEQTAVQRSRTSGTNSSARTPCRSPAASAPTSPRRSEMVVGIISDIEHDLRDISPTTAQVEGSLISKGKNSSGPHPRAGVTTRRKSDISLDDIDAVREKCGGNIGLLFTDAAHTILSGYSRHPPISK